MQLFFTTCERGEHVIRDPLHRREKTTLPPLTLSVGEGVDSKRRFWRKWGAWPFQVQGSAGENGKEKQGAELGDST